MLLILFSASVLPQNHTDNKAGVNTRTKMFETYYIYMYMLNINCHISSKNILVCYYWISFGLISIHCLLRHGLHVSNGPHVLQYIVLPSLNRKGNYLSKLSGRNSFSLIRHRLILTKGVCCLHQNSIFILYNKRQSFWCSSISLPLY